jgi:hypothetical protein
MLIAILDVFYNIATDLGDDIKNETEAQVPSDCNSGRAMPNRGGVGGC